MFRSIALLLTFLFAPLLAQETYPVVVLGSGVGGLTSALYLGRAGITPVVIEGKSPGGAIAQSSSVQNWPGEKDIAGSDLVDKIRQQVLQQGAILRPEEIVAVNTKVFPYLIVTRDIFNPEKTHEIYAYSLVIALGSSPNTLKVPGETEYFSRGVYTCAVCDGALYKGKTVTVVGGGDAAVTQVHYLSSLAKKVNLLVRSDQIKAKDKVALDTLYKLPNVEIKYKTEVKQIIGDGTKVTALRLNNGEITTDALFLAIGSKPNSQFFEKQLSLDAQGYILLKKGQETSLPGIYAIGDITDPLFKQAISASGDGAKASLQVQHFLASKQIKTSAIASTDKTSQHSIDIKSIEEFNNAVKNSAHPVLVDFYATWCGPCKTFSPLFESLAKKHAGTYTFLKVNVDKFPELSQRYQIQAMPTLLILDNQGKVKDKKIGTDEIAQFTKALK